MGWFSGITKAFEKDVSKDVTKDLEKSEAKAVEKGMSSGTVAVIAGVPVVGQFLLGLYAADNVTEVANTLIENPVALAVVAGTAILILR